jgi:tRNA nucleotidyltransferase (CCA-adding enzyme)
MHTLPHHFEKLLKAMQPPDNRLTAARDLPPKVRDYLKGCTDVVTVSPHTRLAGSYARSTAAGDVKDVDILVILDQDYQKAEPSLALTALGEAKAGLPEALGYDEGEVETLTQRRSHHMYFADEDFISTWSPPWPRTV